MQIEELNLDVRTYNQVKRAGITSAEELLERLYQPESVRHFSARVMLHIEQALKAAGAAKYVRGDYITEADIDPQPLSWEALHGMCGKLVARDISTESKRQFRVCWIYQFSEDDARIIFQFNGNNYANAADDSGFYALKSEPDAVPEPVIVSAEYTRAVTLTKSIIAHAQAMQASLWEVCKGLKEMRDGKLYKELGYQNFEEYCEREIGIKRRQAHNYILIAENMTAENVQSIAQIGTTKLTMLAMLDEPQREQIVGAVDVETATVRELKAQITALKKQSEQAEKSRTDAEKRAQGWYDKYSEQGEQIASLNAQITEQAERIDELESRPVEVAVPEPSREVQNMQDAMRRINREHEEWSARIQDEHIREIQRIHADYRRKMEAMKTDGSAVFSVYLDAAADAVSRLSEWVKAHGDSTAKKQSAEMLRTFWLEITDNGGQ
jgi:hypothetical protein